MSTEQHLPCGRRGGQKGGVDIRVECVTPDGLSGKKRDLVSWYFHLIGILGKSPVVSKLQKAESAQHSVHPTGGSLRVFRQFAWLKAGSVKVA